MNDAHPLLTGVVIAKTSEPEALGLNDVYGHGTRVSGIAAYGDIRDCLGEWPVPTRCPYRERQDRQRSRQSRRSKTHCIAGQRNRTATSWSWLPHFQSLSWRSQRTVCREEGRPMDGLFSMNLPVNSTFSLSSRPATTSTSLRTIRKSTILDIQGICWLIRTAFTNRRPPRMPLPWALWRMLRP